MFKFRIIDIVKVGFFISWKTAFSLFLQTHISKGASVIKFKVKGTPISLRRNTSDISVFKQVFLWKEYEYPVSGEVKTVIDAGANIGMATLFFYFKFPNAKLVAIEPDKSNFDILTTNTQTIKNLVRINKGLWSESCYLRLLDKNTDKWSFSFEKSETPSEFEAVSIGDIMKQHNLTQIDILKMDIEGAEKNVFAANTEWLKLVKYLFIETHDFVDNQSSRPVLTAMLQHNFSLFTMGENLIFMNNETLL